MDTQDGMHAAIRIALPRQRCGEVRDMIEVLSVLEDVYNHLYAWHVLAEDGAVHAKRDTRRKSLPEISDAGDLVPADRHLCFARVEVEPPAFIEVVGAREPIEMIYSYLKARDGEHEHRSARAIEKIDAVRSDIEHLWESNYPENEIQQAISMHVVAPLKRLERLDGIDLYDREELIKASARRTRADRPTVPQSPPVRGH
jgi:hypothetical protein